MKDREHSITLIPGDGIGYEVSAAAQSCVDAIASLEGFIVIWDEQQAGGDAMREFGNVLPEKTLNSIRKSGVALKGPITTPIGKGFRSVNVELRQKLNLFANIRPAKSIVGASSRYSGIDIVVIRENTEDLYAGVGFEKGNGDTKQFINFVNKKRGTSITEDSAISLKIISSHASARIARFAFDYANQNARKKVTVVHKANILKYTDGLFLDVARRISRGHMSIEFDDAIVDNVSMQLVTKPENYDILLCPNLYGDILSDLCAGLIGGLGVAPSANIGEKCAVFEPVHGSAPKHEGKNDANPSATILSAAMMLKHIGEKKASARLEKAVLKTIREGKVVTYDLKPRKVSTTKEMTGEIIDNL
ncbi:MAG: isocitrate/isopropylmalate dehydrogenase family protein [Candidatus Micrarchaeota archaeon]|nr:isocitrate/isopropylmalate dehydrogenase family protein [Candidatus Micrarchaeota archaeon]MDE1864436.1 isocitrate/isopropylmalate dehydrogenase family protein [Candidatus Micrarchaeota archaeon]